MKKISEKIILGTYILLLPLITSAQGDVVGGNPSRLNNPLCSGGTCTNDLPTLITRILDIVVRIGGYVALMFLIYSGFLFVKARGNSEELENAKKTFFYTVIGVAILLGAKGLSLALGNTINQLVN